MRNTCVTKWGSAAEKAGKALDHKLLPSGGEGDVSLGGGVLDCSALSGRFQRP